MRQDSTSWYQIKSGNKWALPSPPALLIPGGLGAGGGLSAELGPLLAGGLGVGVPRPVPVGAVAYRLLVNVDPLPTWDHPDPGKAVGT